MKRVRINVQILWESVSCASFGGLLFYLVATNKYLLYVTPKTKGLLLFTAFVLLVWALQGLQNLFLLQHRVRVAHCLSLIVPVLLLLVPHRSLKAADFNAGQANNHLVIARKQAVSATMNETPASPVVTTISKDSIVPELEEEVLHTEVDLEETIPEELPEPELDWDMAGSATAFSLPGLNIEQKKITVSNDFYGQWVYELYSRLEFYEGYTLEITGYAYQDEVKNGQNAFLLARLAMICCAADLFPFGVTTITEGDAAMILNHWVTIEGIIQIRSNGEYLEPQIVIRKLQMAEEVEGYVYPF